PTFAGERGRSSAGLGALQGFQGVAEGKPQRRRTVRPGIALAEVVTEAAERLHVGLFEPHGDARVFHQGFLRVGGIGRACECLPKSDRHRGIDARSARVDRAVSPSRETRTPGNFELLRQLPGFKCSPDLDRRGSPGFLPPRAAVDTWADVEARNPTT